MDQKIEEIEIRLQKLEKKIQSTSLLSDYLFKRSFAVLGHYWFAAIIISIPLIVLMVTLISLIASFFLPEVQDYGW